MRVAGRDYHTFNTEYRDNPSAHVVGFTHAQVLDCLDGSRTHKHTPSPLVTTLVAWHRHTPPTPTHPPNVNTKQIPHIESSRYPPELCGHGALYPRGLPIWPESQLETVIAEQHVDSVVLAYRCAVCVFVAVCAVLGCARVVKTVCRQHASMPC